LYGIDTLLESSSFTNNFFINEHFERKEEAITYLWNDDKMTDVMAYDILIKSYHYRSDILNLNLQKNRIPLNYFSDHELFTSGIHHSRSNLYINYLREKGNLENFLNMKIYEKLCISNHAQANYYSLPEIRIIPPNKIISCISNNTHKYFHFKDSLIVH
jgi:hypothetical protein